MTPPGPSRNNLDQRAELKPCLVGMKGRDTDKKLGTCYKLLCCSAKLPPVGGVISLDSESCAQPCACVNQCDFVHFRFAGKGGEKIKKGSSDSLQSPANDTATPGRKDDWHDSRRRLTEQETKPTAGTCSTEENGGGQIRC